MQPAQSGLDQLKQRMKGTWMAGDFGQIARYSAKAAEEFVDRLNVKPGMQVLDVACGTGNLAIPAARKGASLHGADIATNLIEQARQRAASEGLHATFQEGDAEELPYPDASFDLVMTMFGAMFAPRPERVAAELTRVCRPGGVVAMANWTPEGLVGKFFEAGARHVPPPKGIPTPVLWGKEEVVRQRLGRYSSEIRTTRRTSDFDFPFPPREAVQFFRDYFGPVQLIFSRLPPDGQATYSSDIEKLWSDHNESTVSGRTFIRNEYLEVIATRS